MSRDNKMKKLKTITYAFLIIIGLMIGISVAAIIHNHDVYSPWWGHIIVVLATLFLGLLIHELTHAFVFSVQGVKIKAVYLFMFMFIRKGRIFTIKINPKLLMLGGGLVIPSLPPVTSEEDLDKLQKKFAISLIAAPITSIVFGFLWFIGFILILFLSHNWILISLSITSTFVMLIFSLLTIIASKASSDLAMGDFPAYQEVLKNRYFLISIIDNYLHFNESSYYKSQPFINEKINEYLLNEPLKYTQLSYFFISSYLFDVVFNEGKRNYNIEEKIKKLNIKILAKTMLGHTIAYLIAYLNYISGDIEQALNQLKTIEKSSYPSILKKHALYESKRAKHNLGLSNEIDFLTDEKNIDNGHEWILKPALEVTTNNSDYIKVLKPGIKLPKIKFFTII